MNRHIWSGILLVAALSSLAAQDNKDRLNTYQRNFETAGIGVKIQILQEAAGNPEGLGPLFHQVLSYVWNNASLLPVDQRLRQLSSLAAEQIQKLRYGESRDLLWRLFEVDPDTRFRVAALNALAVVAEGQAPLVRKMADWLDSENQLIASGQKPADTPVILACLRALGEIGDPVAFPAVFAAMNQRLSEEVAAAARAALAGIRGDLADHLREVILTRRLPEKRSALRLAIASDTLPDERKGEVAEAALAMALGTGTATARDRLILREIRYEAARTLRDRSWSRATPLAIEHFNQTLQEFDRGVSDKQALIEAIQCLGSMGQHDAAVRLSKYLVLLNSYMEKGQGTDEQIMLALLENLGRLGDKVAFDDLVYIQYLGYSNRIKKAARQAQESLKW